MKKWMAFFLIAAMLLGTAGCRKGQAESNDLMKDITSSTQPEVPADPAQLGAASQNFGTRLLQSTMKQGENTLISPLSVMYALGMTGNGAREETKAQMEQVLGIPVEQLNPCLRDYAGQSTDALSLANGIWFRDDPQLRIRQEFLQINQDFYDAALRQAPFDEGTLKEINRWVEEKTDGMVKDILDEIPEDAVMYLVNALAFTAQWEEPYENSPTDWFTNFDGSRAEVPMMYSEESTYLEGEGATGFLKPYQGGRYAFVGILPEKDVDSFVQSLTGEKLASFMASAREQKVNTAMPKFQTDFDAELGEALKAMGMPLAFDSANADFKNMGESDRGKLYIGRVLHKTHIEVAEQGTRAGAATAVEIKCESAAEPIEVKSVILDRPFLYMIWDCENHVPVFMGTMVQA